MSRLIGPIKVFTAFIYIAEAEQITEIEEYLREKGCDIEVRGEEELPVRIQIINEKCRAVFQDQNTPPQELEGLMYCIVSLFHIVPYDQTASLLDEFCKSVLSGVNNSNAKRKMRMLGLIFCQFDMKDPICSVVMWHRVRLAMEMNLGGLLSVNADKFKQWMEWWKFSLEDKQKMLNMIWDCYRKYQQKSLSTSVRILSELLSLYTSANASLMAEQAKELIILLISDPDCYVFDNVLGLEPIKSLKSQKVYQLLQIFVQGKLSSFLEFCQSDRVFLEGLGLDYSFCERKMQMLTLTTLAVESREVPFSLLCSELHLGIPELEQLIIDAIRLKLISGTINHVHQKLIIMNCVHRTFGQQQWQSIHNTLSTWRHSIAALHDNMAGLKRMQPTAALPTPIVANK